MNRQVKQILGLSAFAAGCMALGMGLSHGWQAQAQEEKPVPRSRSRRRRCRQLTRLASWVRRAGAQ